MKEGYWLEKDHPGVYQGVKQALDEDYRNSGFDRGHLNPSGHHAGGMFEGEGSRWQCPPAKDTVPDQFWPIGNLGMFYYYYLFTYFTY